MLVDCSTRSHVVSQTIPRTHAMLEIKREIKSIDGLSSNTHCLGETGVRDGLKMTFVRLSLVTTYVVIAGCSCNNLSAESSTLQLCKYFRYFTVDALAVVRIRKQHVHLVTVPQAVFAVNRTCFTTLATPAHDVSCPANAARSVSIH